MEQEKLNEIVANHVKWLQDEGGKRADLRYADLSKADLRGVDLRYADLCHADLRKADLEGADLSKADLCGVDLCGAKLPIGVYQIVGPGSRNRCTTYVAVNDQVICGCWDDGAGNKLNSFARRIEEIYGTKGETPNSKYYAEYMSAINFFRAMKELK